MEVGQTKIYTVDGKNYETTVMIISGDNSSLVTKLIVNDEVTDQMAKGDTYTLKDGNVVAIKEILPTKMGDTVQSLVEFYLGATEIVLDGASGKITINDEQIDGAWTSIDFENMGSTLKLNGFNIAFAPSEETFVGIGERLSDNFNSMDSRLLLNKLGIDYLFRKVSIYGYETVKLSSSGTNNYKIEFTNKKGTQYSFNAFYKNGSNFGVGAGNNQISYAEGSTVCSGNSFIVQSSQNSRVLELRDISSIENKMTIKDLGTGESIDYSINAESMAVLLMDGYSYKVRVLNGTNCISLVDISDDVSNVASLFTKNGAKIAITSEGFELFDPVGKKVIKILGTTNATILDFANSVWQYPLNMIALESISNMAQGYSSYGIWVIQSNIAGQDSWEFTIPDREVTADVVVQVGNSGNVATSAGGSGGN